MKISQKGRIEQLVQLLTVTYDGNLISKPDRDELVKSGMADRLNGWNFITHNGIIALENLGILQK